MMSGNSKKRERRAPYLPRGLRQRLADHFHLTKGAIDARIRNGHKETIDVAKKIIAEHANEVLRKRKETLKRYSTRKFRQQLKYFQDAVNVVTGTQLNLYPETQEPADAENPS